MTRNPAHFDIPMTIIIGLIFVLVVGGGAWFSAVAMNAAVNAVSKHLVIKANIQ